MPENHRDERSKTVHRAKYVHKVLISELCEKLSLITESSHSLNIAVVSISAIHENTLLSRLGELKKFRDNLSFNDNKT